MRTQLKLNSRYPSKYMGKISRNVLANLIPICVASVTEDCGSSSGSTGSGVLTSVGLGGTEPGPFWLTAGAGLGSTPFTDALISKVTYTNPKQTTKLKPKQLKKYESFYRNISNVYKSLSENKTSRVARFRALPRSTDDWISAAPHPTLPCMERPLARDFPPFPTNLTRSSLPAAVRATSRCPDRHRASWGRHHLSRSPYPARTHRSVTKPALHRKTLADRMREAQRAQRRSVSAT